MAKKKTGAKKVTKKAAKAAAPKAPAKPKPPTESKPAPAEAAPPAAPSKPKPKPKPKPKATFSSMPKSSAKNWPGKHKGYPDPFHVDKEYKTAKHRIFVLKKDDYIYKIYKTRKMIFPLDPTD